ncbi:MAG: response regulator [Treponema sp.]|nr:response regulator [Treponema sp.]
MQHSLKNSCAAWLRRPTTPAMLVSFALTLAVVLARQAFISRDLDFAGTHVVDFTDLILVLVFTSLNGSVAGSLLCFCIAFITSLSVGLFSYETSVFMLTSVFAYMPVYRRWYRTVRGTLASAARFLLLGVAWGVLLALMHGEPVSALTMVGSLVVTLPGCVGVAAFCYLFFNRAPVRVLRHFVCGTFYLDESELTPFRWIALRQESRLQRKIKLLIISMAAVMVLGAVFMANMIMRDMEGQLNDTVGSLFRQLRGLPPRHGGPLTFALHFNDFFVTDVTLVLLLLQGAIPIALIANHVAQERIALPILLMERAMDDFMGGTSGDGRTSVLAIRLLPIATNDEIQDLHRTLCKTTANMTSYIDHVRNEERLRGDLRVAQEANKAKSAFLSNMSHEIRTPINAVLGFDEMILREATEPAIRDYARDIRNSGKTLLSLINDILDFSKIEAGKMEIIPVQYELSSAVNDLVNMIRKKAEDKHLALTVRVDPAIPHLLFGDEVRVKQCALNILTNAVKYTHEGSVTLNVTHKRTGDDTIALTVQVIDTGIGIKEADVQKLFTAFERIEEERNRTIEGTGLGMNIVQQLLSMMGSSLVVKSEYGKGSDFSFTVEQKVLDWEPVGDMTRLYHAAAEAAYRESFTAPDARILVADDTPLNLKVVQGLLKQTRIQIDTAESGRALLGLARQNRYDAIFIDHRMPDMDGVETLHALQGLADSKNAGVPCIALTANAISGAREYYLSEGFTDYLSKPIDSAKLEKMLRTYLPADKVRLTQEGAPQDGDGAKADAADFPAMEGIDLAEALKNCGNADILREAFKDFHANIAAKSAQIAALADARDWKNYTVLVHALKSSARLVGALQLSADAKYLEACGDRGDAAEIAAKTPALLELYRKYQELLAPVAGSEKPDAEKPDITPKAWNDALAALREVVGAFDFSTADAIVEQVDGYRLPAAYAARWQDIRTAVANVDQAAAMQALDGK